MTLVDTNVLIDLLKADPQWLPWSLAAFQQVRSLGPLGINVVVYAELAAHPYSPEKLDVFLADLQLEIQQISKDAARAAAGAFMRYRKLEGKKTGVLPDFFVGAQAQAMDWLLLTRDSARYKTYFPKVKLVSP